MERLIDGAPAMPFDATRKTFSVLGPTRFAAFARSLRLGSRVLEQPLNKAALLETPAPDARSV
jgi:hypothetical protein